MQIIINAKNMEVSDYLRDTVEKKVSKLSKYFKPEIQATVHMTIQRSKHIVEITIPCDSIVMRAEIATGDMYASIDGCLKKMERQILKHRTKLERRLRADAYSGAPIYEDTSDISEELEIVRTKKYSIKPMTIEEAIMQFELLNHSFFVFVNASTSSVNVIYARNDGGIGLLEPEYD